MINAPKAILNYLKTQVGVTALTTTARIYAESSAPPAQYRIEDGAAVTFKVRGGSPDYSDALLTPSVQFQCWGQTPLLAHQLYQALYAALQGAHNGVIKWARCEQLGQALTSEAGWPMVLTFFRMHIVGEEPGD